jgi:hypothetical protein
MGQRIHFNQDVVAGLMFICFGAFFLWFGQRYSIGSTLRMGPGYMPMLLGWSLVGIGAIIAGKGTVQGGDKLERWALRPLIAVCSAFLAFAWLIESVGLVVTGMLCMLCAAVGSPEFRAREQAILAIAATILASALFIRALGLPMRFWPTLFGG